MKALKASFLFPSGIGTGKVKTGMKKIFVNISIFLLMHLNLSKFKISFKISSLSTDLKENCWFFLRTFPMVSIAGDFYILLSLLKRVPECFLPMDGNYCNQ